MFNLLTGIIAKVIKKSAIKNGSPLVRLTIKNIFGYGNNLSDVNIINPYGTGNIPSADINVFVTSINNSEKTLYSLGTVSVIPSIYREPEEGESWNYSQKYVLAYQNDGIKAYRIAETPDFYCTLPNGQAFVQMMLNRINEMQVEIDYLKTHKHEAGTLQAPNGPVTGSTGVPTSPPPEPTTLNKDKTYLTNGKALIDDLGENYS